MGKRATVKTGFQISKATKPGLYYTGDVPGLALQVSANGARSWVLRLVIAGKRREMGLGSYSPAGIAEVKKKALSLRAQAADGVDPVAERRAARSAAAAARSADAAAAERRRTFDECAAAYIAAHAAGWRNAKHGDQWRNTLRDYASPAIGKLLVSDVATEHIVGILTRDNFWTEKTETASRVRGRLERVLSWATTSGFRSGENPARWKGHLENLLPKTSSVQTVEHHAAYPWRTIGTFVAELRQRQGMGARALEFAVLTAARSGEARGATWSEIDLDAATWTIPAGRMKAKAEHIVPLSPPALALLQALPRMAGTDLVFPSSSLAPLSDMTLAAVLRRMKVDATTHGFRSSFRDWCSETTNYPREVAEKCLAHAIPSAVEAAYRRGALLDKRRNLMNEWATFCARLPAPAATVTPINASVAVVA